MAKTFNTNNVYFKTDKKIIGVAYRVPEGVHPNDIVIIEITEDESNSGK